MQRAIGKNCGPFGPCSEHECRHWRPLILDEVGPDGKISGTREEWDCAIDWGMFLHQSGIKRTNDVRIEIESFRKGFTEASPNSPFGIFVLSLSSMAQSVAHTIEQKGKSAWQRFLDRKPINS